MIESTNQQTITPDPRQTSRQTLIAHISSPLPPPEMLIGYERAQSGLINKIIEMIEHESGHRRELEKNKLQAEIISLQRGDALISKAQVFAFLLSSIAILIGGITGLLCLKS